MESLGYYNGKYGPLEQMTVPMNDRACYFGDGLYEVAYCRNYKIYALDEHIDRMYSGAATLGISIPYTKQELADIICSLTKKLDSHEQIVYWQISRGTEPRQHAPGKNITANLWITLRPKTLRDIYKPLKLISLEDTRFFHCNMKTLNLLPSVLASAAAEDAGVDEAVLHRNGRVTECAHSNISIYVNGKGLVTAPADNLILAGVARAHLLSTCRSLGIKVYEEPYTLTDLMRADEVIITSSGMPCCKVTEIDGKAVGGRAALIVKQLQDAILKDFIDLTE